MKKLLGLILLLAAPVGAAPRMLIQPRAVSPMIMPLVKPLALGRPLFDISFTRPGSGGGGGGGGWGTEPSSNGCTARTGSHTFTSVTFTADVGVSITNGDCQGTPTIGIDTSVVGTFSQGSGAVPGSGAIGTWYFRTTTPAIYAYPNTDIEHWVFSMAAGQGTGQIFQTSAQDTLEGLTVSEDNVLVGGATKWEKKALPDCDDSGGSHLNYDTTTNAWSCGTSSGSSTINPATTYTLYDDFQSGSTTANQQGNTGLASILIATGTVSVPNLGAANNPGLLRLNSHATNDNSGALVMWNGGIGGSTWSTVFDGHDYTLDAVVQLGSNSTAITSTDFFFGLSNSAAALNDGATNLIGIRRDTDLSETNFKFVVCNNSGASGCNSAADSTNIKVNASTVTPSAGTFYRFRVTNCTACGPAGVRMISMRVNDETALTFCSSGCDDTLGTVPSGTALNPVIIYATRTTTGVLSADADYIFVNITGLTRY